MPQSAVPQPREESEQGDHPELLPEADWALVVQLAEGKVNGVPDPS